MARPSQRMAIACHLKAYGSITSLEAITQYGCTRLSGVIFALKEKGMNIETTMKHTKNKYGNAVNFAEYTYIKEGNANE